MVARAVAGTRDRRGPNVARSGPLRGGATTQCRRSWDGGLAALGHCRTECCVIALVFVAVGMRKRSRHDATVPLGGVEGGWGLSPCHPVCAVVIRLGTEADVSPESEAKSQE